MTTHVMNRQNTGVGAARGVGGGGLWRRHQTHKNYAIGLRLHSKAAIVPVTKEAGKCVDIEKK